MNRQVEFSKYHGTGNDFILIDQMQEQFDLSTEEIAFLCHRRFGIGADGLMLLRPYNGYDFEMVYFNSDGNRSSMCGNGGRCIVQFAHDLGYIKSDTHFIAVDGPHAASINEGVVSLQMIDVDGVEELDFENTFVLNTGSPHYVRFTSSDEDLQNIVAFGKIIRYSSKYTDEGINVNLVKEMDKNRIAMTTYERGVEDETYSCGTGVTAAAIAYGLKNDLEGLVSVSTKGGNLAVNYRRIGEKFIEVVLTAEAKFVFKGTFQI